MPDRKPWELVPALEERSLSVIATILWRCRNEAIEDLRHLRTKGVTTWGLGCISFEYSIRAILRAAASGEFPWLTIMDSSARFVFRIKDAPFRFYRGDEEKDAPFHHAFGSDEELVELQLALLDSNPIRGVLRFILTTTPQGAPEAVVFARVTTDGELHDKWQIPLLALSSVDVAFRPDENVVPLVSQAPTSTMDAPKVTPKTPDAEKASGEEPKSKEA